MRLLARPIWLLLLLGLLPACEVFDAGDDKVFARTLGEAVFVTNKTDARIYYFAVGRETAALINWAPHLNPAWSVAREATTRLSPADIHATDSEKEAIVYWWHADERDEGPIAGEIQGLLIDL